MRVRIMCMHPNVWYIPISWGYRISNEIQFFIIIQEKMDIYGKRNNFFFCMNLYFAYAKTISQTLHNIKIRNTKCMDELSFSRRIKVTIDGKSIEPIS